MYKINGDGSGQYTMSINPVHPDVISYHSCDNWEDSGTSYRLYVRRYNCNTHTFANQLGTDWGDYHTRYGGGLTEWDSTGTKVMMLSPYWSTAFMCRCTFNYQQYTLSVISNGRYSANQVCLINDVYCIVNNTIRRISNDSIVSTIANFPSNGYTHIWSVNDIVFNYDDANKKLYAWKIDLSNGTANKILDMDFSYQSQSNDVGSYYWPTSNSGNIFMSSLTSGIRFEYGSFEKITHIQVKGNDLMNVESGNITPSDVLLGKIGYTKNGEVVGSMPNNGELNYTPSTKEQTIPAGYTSGGTIGAFDWTSASEYQTCLDITEDILGQGGVV